MIDLTLSDLPCKEFIWSTEVSSQIFLFNWEFIWEKLMYYVHYFPLQNSIIL